MSNDTQLPQDQLIEGRYRIAHQIAQGGMATVYEATDERLNRTVALKVMHAQLADGPHREQFIERFRREAQSAAQIANPHIVQVYDAGETNGLAYLVMEYVHGVNLRHEMNRQRTFSVRETLRIIGETLDGLASAHRANVVHRDIKPENIMLNDRGRVQITDFGLAKVASSATLSSTGMLLGTAAYLPPETIERNEATPQGDLYAVGIMAWEMLAGEVPFTSDNPVTLVFKHVHEDVPSISTPCPGIDSTVASFITHLTERSIDARPKDASEALDELRQLSSVLPIEAWQYRKAVDSDDASLAAPPKPPSLTERHDDGASSTSVMQATKHDTLVHQTPTTSISTASTQVLQTVGEANGAQVPTDGHAGKTEATFGSKAKPKSRKPLIISIIAVLFAAALGGGAWWYFLGPGSYWTLPKPNDISCEKNKECPLTGADWKSYESTLKVAGIPYSVEQNYSDTIEQDHIVSATINDKQAGVDSHVGKRNGQSVSIVVSKGVKMATIPKDILDSNSENGKNPLEALKNAGLTNVKHDEAKDAYSLTVPEGAALSVSPDPGTTVKHSAEVVVTLSKGLMPVTMPDIAGRSKDEAQQALDDLKLKANYSEEFSDSVAAGNVISTSVKKDTQLHWGDSVDVVVSKGPQTVTIPDVRGKSYDEASKILTDLGLQVKKSAPLGDLTHNVRLQDPDPGAQVRVRDSDGNATVVTLTVV
ncbi:protein kinase domain-containing protein [Bifidobacterium panos]|uniref:non-specific serine/threonine protein kinase n=1 Tax=Bifidobacterium panos TaxID=2675321 RepID=A0ABX1SWM6_9BIFI|nr:PASTA domain-containing protein [Bifidobacterium sp. DSM 109963]NMN02239.1 serine/threonine protein kinase [Bifidobacterium sp. DSM 109963]